MIKLRLASTQTEKGDLELEIVSGETLEQAVQRVTEKVKLDSELDEVFHVLVNGHIIEKELWTFTKLVPSDSVLVAPKMKGDDGLRLGLAVVATVLITAFPPAAALGVTSAFGAGVINALGAIAVGLLVNALIPPTIPDFNLGGGSLESSQMYSINSQSNQVKRFGYVPKVYGNHKMFPIVAANPYTDLEVDPVSGELVQYFYGIYDFGLGPATVEDLRIGDTSIANFNDVSFNLVDPNRPDIPEGEWDNSLKKTFSLYKSQLNTESITLTLDGNLDDNDDPSTYQAIRSAVENPDGKPQEINLTFVCPQGLYSLGSNGARSPRTIDLKIEFSKESENVWRKWNDLTYVESFVGAGGDEFIENFRLNLIAPSPPGVLPSYYAQVNGYIISTGLTRSGSSPKSWSRTYGLTPAMTGIYVRSGELSVGDNVSYGQGKFLGSITSVTPNAVQQAGIWYDFCSCTIPEVIEITRYRGRTQPFEGFPSSWQADFLNQSLFRVRTGTGIARISRDETSPVYASFKFTPRTTERIKVRVTRVRSFSDNSYQIGDSLTWQSLNTRFQAAPIVTDKRHVFMEIRIKATNQLNGSIQNLSGVVTSVLDVWDGSQWVKQPTSNPAWVYADLLTGQVNKRAIAKSRLNTASLLEWANYCDEIPTSSPSFDYSFPRFRCNFILDFATPLQNLINQVTGSAQADTAT
jgi:hypothetical protein